MDIHNYIRKLNIKRYLLSNPIKDPQILREDVRHSGLSNASLFNPPGSLAPSLGVFRELVVKDLETLSHLILRGSI